MKILTVWAGEQDVEIGDWILVPCGGSGTQVAQVLAFTKKGLVRVRKWRKASVQWTHRISISPRAVIEKMTAAAARKKTGPRSGIEVKPKGGGDGT